MNRITLFAAVLCLVSCTSNEDTYNLNAVEKETKAQAEKMLGFPISDEQTWNMTTPDNKLTITNFPEDLTTDSISIWDANPLIDSTATKLIQTEKTSTITYELPAHLTTLYAVCMDKDGDVRVQPFKASDGTADFTAERFVATTKSPTRAPARIAAATELNWQPTFNAQNMADKGWNDQFALIDRGGTTKSFTNFCELDQMYKNYFPEGHWNNRRLNGKEEIRTCYSTTIGKGGGEITVTPVHKESSVGQMFGYYYYEKGQEKNIKTVKKYVFSDPIYRINDDQTECTQNAYKLVYYDQNGNPSYTFPEGTQIGFFAHIKKSNTMYIDWFPEGIANDDLSNWLWDNRYITAIKQGRDGWQTFNHVSYFQRNGINYIGFEDWTDFDYNDLVLMLDGNIEPLPIADIVTERNWFVYTFAFEDSREGDYDLNDIVLQVYRDQKWTSEGNRPCIFVKLVAVGATHNIKVYYKDTTGEIMPLFDGKEVHEVMGIEPGSFANTKTINVKKCPVSYIQRPSDWYGLNDVQLSKADIYIVNETTGMEIHTPASQGLKGAAPLGLCIPKLWAWPLERMATADAYDLFQSFSGDIDVDTDWYVHPNRFTTIVTE